MLFCPPGSVPRSRMPSPKVQRNARVFPSAFTLRPATCLALLMAIPTELPPPSVPRSSIPPASPRWSGRPITPRYAPQLWPSHLFRNWRPAAVDRSVIGSLQDLDDERIHAARGCVAGKGPRRPPVDVQVVVVPNSDRDGSIIPAGPELKGQQHVDGRTTGAFPGYTSAGGVDAFV